MIWGYQNILGHMNTLYNRKIFVNFMDLSSMVFFPKYLDTSRVKFANTVRPKCVNSSCIYRDR